MHRDNTTRCSFQETALVGNPPKPFHVLLVEDNAVNQEVGRAMLEALGYRVNVADNGMEALEAASDTRYDLIFMDCQMPLMDGYEATRRIRAMEGLKKDLMTGSGLETPSPVPIIALTAHATQSDKEQCLAAGMDDYMSKPYNLRQLKNMLEHYANHRSFSSPTPDSTTTKTKPTSLESTQETSGEEIEPPYQTDPSVILDPAPLDKISYLQEQHNRQILAEVVSLYFEKTPRLLRDLRDAITMDDKERLKKTARNLRSSSSNIGATILVKLCKEVEETLSVTHAAGEAAFLVNRIEEEYARVRPALSEELKRRQQLCNH